MLTFAVPVGQIALATPGACCNPVTKALVATPTPAATSGPTAGIKARPAVSAVSTSPRKEFVFFSGSTS